MNQFKQFVEYIATHYSEDTNEPKEIVQQMACVIGLRLSVAGKLPVSCGKGLGLDMDIVQEGILLGLELLPRYDANKGNLRQFLYKHIAGRMRRYAWRRENRVSDSVGRSMAVEVDDQPSYLFDSGDETEDADGDKQYLDRLTTQDTPETLMEAEEEERNSTETLREALASLSQEDRRVLVQSAFIGRSKGPRAALAASLGITDAALSMRITRTKRKALWAVTGGRTLECSASAKGVSGNA